MVRGVPTYMQSTQMRTKIFQNEKKYMIFLLKQHKIIQMSNVWSEGFGKNNSKGTQRYTRVRTVQGGGEGEG